MSRTAETSISSRRGARARYAIAGILAAAVGLAVAELLVGLLGRATTPVLAVGEAVIDLVPSWLADLAIELFGTNDKAVLVGGVIVVLAGAAAGIGLLASWQRSAAIGAAVALGAVAALAVWTRPDATAVDLLPVLVGFVVAVLSLGPLVDRAARTDPDRAPHAEPDRPATEPDPLAANRRTFVRIAVSAALLAAAAAGVGRLLATRRNGIETARRELDLPRPLPPANTPAGADLEISGAEPWRTPNPVFYRIDTALGEPLVEPEDWRLRVHGMVENELTLTFDQLVGMGLVDRWTTLTCVSNEVGGGLVGNALWTGVRIADVLGAAGPLPSADAVKSTSEDGWTAGTPLDVLTDGRGALLAVGMNGEPLPVEHGFPVRMVVPGLYGYVSATKWLVDLEVTRFDDFDAYWTTRGWAERAPVKVSSRIDVPRSGETVSAGRVAVAGVAWAQHRGIEAVEVRVDGGSWQPARIAAVPSADTWRQWVYEWEAEPGSYRLEVRATTTDGEVQTGERVPPVPDGATGWHAVDVTVD